MQIEFLGTGTSQGVPVIHCTCDVCRSDDPKDRRLRTSVSVKVDEKSYVIDIGPDFRSQMLRSDIPIIDSVFLTHEHNDHVAGMDDLRPYNFKQKKKIPVYAQSRVIKEIKSRYYYAFAESQYPGAPGYEIHEIKHGSRWKDDSVEFTSFEVIHGNLPILSYRINDFVYITDAKSISEESISYSQGAKVVVLNALRKEEHWSHFTLEEAIRMAKKIGGENTYFTHMSHLMGKHDLISEMLPDNIHFAYDGLTIEI